MENGLSLGSHLKRITSFVWFVCQLHITHLTNITVHVEILLHGNNSNRLLRPLHRRDTVSARGTFWRENTMEVVDAVDLVVKVDSERDTVQAFVTDTTTETAGMVGFSHSLKHKHNCLVG